MTVIACISSTETAIKQKIFM